MEIKVRGVNVVRAKGKVYHYHRRTGTRLRAEPGTAAFMAEVEALDKQVEVGAAPIRAGVGSLGHLFTSYKRSPEFLDLGDRTRRDYDKVMAYLAPLHVKPLFEMNGPIVLGIRDRATKKHGRRFGNYVVQVIRLCLSWGMSRGLVRDNVARGIALTRRPRNMARANRPWTEDEVATVMKAASEGVRAAVALGLYAGLRQGDALTFSWSRYDGKSIAIQQAKTGDPLWLPTHARLREVLDATRKRSPVVVTGEGGKPYTGSGFRASFFRLIRDLKAKGEIGDGLTFHGLRHTTGTVLADLGFDTATIAAYLGQRSTAMAEHYSRDAKRKLSVQKAVAAWEEKTG